MPELTLQEDAPRQDEERHIPLDLAPQDEEAAILSLLATQEGDDWIVAAGPLISVPVAVAEMSWIEWGSEQPQTREPRAANTAPDLGATFTDEPFPGIRMTRMVVKHEDWTEITGQIEAGGLETPGGAYRLELDRWSATKLFVQSGLLTLARSLPERGGQCVGPPRQCGCPIFLDQGQRARDDEANDR